MTVRRLLAVLAAALVGAAAGQVAVPGAQAAGGYCAQGTGVTVVVDNGSMGGGTSVGCDVKGAKVAGSTVVPRAGFPLTYVARQPGFVCRVRGLPTASQDSCADTPPADAYWGLFWSDGTTGRWTYSSVGIGSLKVPAGGFIGWRFQSSSTRTVPGTAPTSPKPAPSPTPKPSPKPTSQPSPKPAPAPTTASAPRPSATATRTGSATSPTASERSTTPSRPSTPSRTRASSGSAQPSSPAAATTSVTPTGTPTATKGASSPAAPSAGDDATPAASGTRTTGGSSTGSGATLPLFAAGLLVALLGSAGVLAWRRRQA